MPSEALVLDVQLCRDLEPVLLFLREAPPGIHEAGENPERRTPRSKKDTGICFLVVDVLSFACLLVGPPMVCCYFCPLLCLRFGFLFPVLLPVGGGVQFLFNTHQKKRAFSFHPPKREHSGLADVCFLFFGPHHEESVRTSR